MTKGARRRACKATPCERCTRGRAVVAQDMDGCRRGLVRQWALVEHDLFPCPRCRELHASGAA
eukprot:11226530-Lingulodinium_polyedra.AAC.1